MKTRKAAAFATALVILAIVAWTAIRAVRVSAAAPKSEIPVTRVKRGRVAVTVVARGDLQGGNPEVLTAPQVAQDTLAITEIRHPGDLVQAGDIVVQFDTTQQEYNLQEAQSDLAEAQQKVLQTESDNQASDEESGYSLEAARLQVELAGYEVRRNPVLPAIKQRDNKIALEAANNRYRQAQEDIANRKTTTAAAMAIQRAAVARASSLADMAGKNIENMTLRAKTSGYVSLQPDTFNTFYATRGMTFPPVQIGSTVRPGMVVAQIPDMKNWEFASMVSELDRGHLVVGQPVSISVVALGGRTFAGRVRVLGNPSGQAWDRKFDCRMSLDRADADLRPGMSANAVITAEQLDNVLWAPSQALFERDGRSFVYLQTPGGFTPRDVALVTRSESQVVLNGVNEGDVVALSNPSEQGKAASQPASAMKAISK